MADSTEEERSVELAIQLEIEEAATREASLEASRQIEIQDRAIALVSEPLPAAPALPVPPS